MTVAELFAALAAAVATAFAGDGWAVWPGPPAATALPAVWPEYDSSFTANQVTGSTVSVRVVAAIQAQTVAAEYGRLFAAHDLLDALDPVPGAGVQSRSAVLGPVDIGQTEHTALLYTFTFNRPLPC